MSVKSINIIEQFRSAIYWSINPNPS